MNKTDFLDYFHGGLFALILILLASAWVDAANAGDHDGYIVMGQSNAAGMINASGLDTKLNARIIGCAKNGQLMDAFEPDYFNLSIYGDCFNKIKTWQANGGIIKGVIFWQGESDASYKFGYDGLPIADHWTQKFYRLFNALNSDIGCHVPWVLVDLNDFYNHSDLVYWGRMRYYQRHTQHADVTHIDSSPYPFLTDDKHLTPVGYDQIGTDIANMFLH